MKILITGSTGFVGKNMLSKLDLAKHTVCAVIRNRDNFFKTFPDLSGKVEVIELDQVDCWERVTEFNPEAVIHLASFLTSKSDNDSIEALIDSNIKFGSLLLNALNKTSLKCFINTGSFSEYHYGDGKLDPTYYYAVTKICFRSVLEFFQSVSGFKIIHVVPYTIYGENDSNKKVIDYLLDSVKSSEPINMSPGNQKLDFIHIDDVSDFYLWLIDHMEEIKDTTSEFHLGTGKGTSLREIAVLLENLLNKKLNIDWGKLPYRDRDTMHSVAPIARLIKYWQPKITIEEGIKRIIIKLKQQ